MSATDVIAVANWQRLCRAAEGYRKDERATAEELSNAARAYVGTIPAAPSTPRPSGGAVFPPYGNARGQPVRGASERDLRFYKAGCERSLADPSKSRWHEKERALLEAIDAELEAR